MELQHYILSAIMLIVTFGLKHSESGLITCSDGEFLDSAKGLCQPCAACPVNEIIRKPCSNHEDTICGPFLEFNRFLQSKSLKNKTKNHHHHDGKVHKHTKKDKLTTQPPVSITGSINNKFDLTSVSSSEAQWKTLAMGLIGVLCIVSVFLAIFVFAVCYVKSRRPVVEKDIIYDPEMMQSSDTYIKVQSFLSSGASSRDRLKNNSQSLQQNDYDSCSDDSYPCGPVPPSIRLLAPVFIPPVADDYDADHSGVSTIKSSDYVYFNVPQNGNINP